MDHSEGLSQRGNVTISIAVIYGEGMQVKGISQFTYPGKRELKE
ncbi:hypothetical protein MmTuc01_3174 [Methanosarcina mazei Tuc01]|uniref:Uncharacterized protein n=1 Tax=Methanosarcina mazei Tuc01 TaxID=1236903 RepID=M1Q1K5_METMZ|nr:hypothetical protein MmTuc01_3174 [Methanosarcina mazei Tuc01]